MVRPCSWTHHRFQVTGGGRTAYKHARVKEYDKEVVNLGEVCSETMMQVTPI